MNAIRFVIACVLLSPLFAQVPDTMKHYLSALPGTSAQSGAELGSSAAIGNGLVVLGAPLDDTGGQNVGIVKVFGETSGIITRILPHPNPVADDRFGAAVAISGQRIVVSAPRRDAGATDAGCVYVFDLAGNDPFTPVAVLTDPTPHVEGLFGISVAIDGMRVVVGKQKNGSTPLADGAAYVYDLATATPTVPVHVLALNEGDNDWLGTSVAIRGSFVLVGAPRRSFEGCVAVWDLSSPTPTNVFAIFSYDSLTLESRTTGFGTAIAVSGSKIVVGAATSYQGGVFETGRAFVYDFPSTLVAIMENATPDADDRFGTTVAISGNKVLIGAPNDDLGAGSNGSVHLYDLTSPTPSVPLAALAHGAGSTFKRFGSGLAASGSGVVVGARGDEVSAPNAGAGFIYNLAGASPSVPVAIARDLSSAGNDHFGQAVAIAGGRVAIGSPANQGLQGPIGGVSVYDLASAVPSGLKLVLRKPSPVVDDLFGNAVAISHRWVVVSAPGDDTGADDAGSVYVFDLTSATPFLPVLTLNNPAPAASDLFGWSIALSGNRLVVGDYQDNAGGTIGGRAFIYDLASATPAVPVFTLNNPTPAANDAFGFTVAISGTRVAIGALGDGTGAAAAGSAYVYDLAGATPAVPVATLNNPSPTAFDSFGSAVAISGTRVVVGTPSDNTGAAFTGSAYAYDVSSATPTVPVALLTRPNPVTSDNFGGAVAISGSRAVVGASQGDFAATDAGNVFVYNLDGATPGVPVATLARPGALQGDQFGAAVALDGFTAVIGAPYDDTFVFDKGAAYIFAPADNDTDDDGLLDLWENARFGTTAGHDADDDADGDGRVELLEQAFDRNPLAPDAAAGPTVVNEGGYLTLTLAKRAGVSYLGQSAATPDGSAFSALTTTVITDNATTLKVRDNFPINSGGQRLLRVQVTAAP